jgi:hypothetical protein
MPGVVPGLVGMLLGGQVAMVHYATLIENIHFPSFTFGSKDVKGAY